MFTKSRQLMIIILLGVLSFTVFSLAGCKKEPEPIVPVETAKAVEAEVADATEQKLCPVMGGEINRELYTEYKGKKVYFCCPGCEETFKEDPDKYLSKLPQFNE
jgi:YHS domain-containing protein